MYHIIYLEASRSQRVAVLRAAPRPLAAACMPFDPNGNPIETCGDQCLSTRFNKDSGRAAASEPPPPVLCGFGCGGYGAPARARTAFQQRRFSVCCVHSHSGDPARGGMCAKCIKDKGFESFFPAAPTMAPTVSSAEAAAAAPVSAVDDGEPAG